MLTFLGFAMVVTFMFLIMTKRLSPVVALIAVPVLFALVGGFGGAGIGGMTPWGGPLARAATALQIDPADVFLPMVPVMVVGIGGVMLLAYLLGMRERVRLSALAGQGRGEAPLAILELESDTCRPRLRFANAILTICQRYALK